MVADKGVILYRYFFGQFRRAFLDRFTFSDTQFNGSLFAAVPLRVLCKCVLNRLHGHVLSDLLTVYCKIKFSFA